MKLCTPRRGPWRAIVLGLVLMALPAPTVASDYSVVSRLAGWLLVASEHMADPNFARTVVYMVEHDAQGAFGLIVNVPMIKVPVGELLDSLGMQAQQGEASVLAHYGGPVEPGRGFFLHSTDVMFQHSKAVAAEVAVTADPSLLSEVAAGRGPTRVLFALGYAGWGPGQLESELERGDWYVIPADISLVFAQDPGKSWDLALTRRAIEL